MEYAKDDDSKRVAMVIHQVEAKPSGHFIGCDDDFIFISMTLIDWQSYAATVEIKL